MTQKQFKRMLSPKECMPNTSASGQHSGLETFACVLRFMVGPFLRRAVSFFFNSTRQIDIINSVITCAIYFVAAKYSIERFSNHCRKTKTKAITLTNHDRNKQRHEPIRIPRNYL